MSDERKPMTDMSVDLGNLYKEESFTDLKVASVKQLTPIKVDGTRDESRAIIFIGQRSSCHKWVRCLCNVTLRRKVSKKLWVNSRKRSNWPWKR